MAMSRREQNGEYATLPVQEVIARVREWVEVEARQYPNFAGAYLWAGITALPPDAPFALYRDVDVVVVVSKDAPEEESEVFYRGLSIEIIWKNLDEHEDVEAILANPSAGPNMAATQILADPTGRLQPLQQVVAEQYAERRWIVARCAKEKADAEAALAKMETAATPAERLDSTRELLMALSGLLAVATLRRPTTRRTLALLGELLDAQGRTDLHERALAVQGSVAMQTVDVRALQNLMMEAYDRAVVVYKTPVPYGFSLREHLRPYYAQGALEMIDEGRDREAVFWITILDIVFPVLQNDAPEAEKAHYAEQCRAMYAAIGMLHAAGWAERVAQARELVADVFRLADQVAAPSG